MTLTDTRFKIEQRIYMVAPQIIYEDDVLLVVNKPANLTVNDAETEKEPTLQSWLLTSKGITIERSGIVHRLDKDTSGVILVGKTIEAVEALQSQFKDRLVQKQYVALVHGYVPDREGTLSEPMGRNPKNRHKFTLLPTGRDAVTEYRVEQYLQMSHDIMRELTEGMNKNQTRFFEHHGRLYTLVNVFPKTGRTHQIRVHFTALRHPLVSDKVYSSRKLVKFTQTWCPRQFLHAKCITFMHPITNEKRSYSADLPADLHQALTVLEAHM